MLFLFLSFFSFSFFFFFFFNDTATTEIYTLSLHDAPPIFGIEWCACGRSILLPLFRYGLCLAGKIRRSEEHTSELQSHSDLVCRLLLEKKKKRKSTKITQHTEQKSTQTRNRVMKVPNDKNT